MELTFKIISSIRSIRSNANFMVGETYESLVWHDGGNVDGENQDKPTEQEFDNAVTAWNREYDAQEYARNRATEYPAIAEQLDEIYHNGIDSWKAVIKVTKDKYPKG